MAKKGIADQTSLDIRKYLEENRLNIGTKTTLRSLRKGKLAKVYLAANCPEHELAIISNEAKISGVELVQLTKSNEELGTVCKKPFSVAAIGLLKGQN